MLIQHLFLKIIEILLFLFAIGLFVPVFVLFVECIAALLPRQQTDLSFALVTRPRVDILVPAHNEAAGINATLQSLLPQLLGQDRLIVIADNCDDETATIARQKGVTVIERQEPECRGKGYALDYGLQFIATTPPDVVVMVDADCIVEPDTIDKLTYFCAATACPVQAVYLLEQPLNPSPKDLVSAFAFTVKNLVRPQGLARLGKPCLLTGTGMAFPWSVIHKASLSTGDIVEDMKLGIDLAIAGHPPKYCFDARVTGILPQQAHAAKSQRTRWEHGHLQTLLHQVPRLVRESFNQKRFDEVQAGSSDHRWSNLNLLALALDLCVPPLSLLVMMWLAAMGVTLLALALGAVFMPISLLTIEGLLILISIFVAWAKYGRDTLPLLTLLTVPLYILSKIPLYLAFLIQPETKWIRTERD